jgi:HSP20 family protein
VPAEVDSDKAKAEFKRGVLTVRIPKAPGAESRRKKIEVKGE